VRKSIALLLVLGVGFFLGVSWKEIIAHATGGGTAIGNGDVNGDGEIDISDVVYTLCYLYGSGTAPVPIETPSNDSPCPPPAAKGLPATGQTMSYWPGDDGDHREGCPVEGRFLDNGDGTVTDAYTGLLWQKETADVCGDGAVGFGDRLSWMNALRYCEDLSFAGHDDWRLPNIRELQSLINFGRLDPAIDPVFGAEPENYWSSTSVPERAESAWYVLFFDGSLGYYTPDVDVQHLVRAVRNAP
jgi:hypothetical protein